MTSKTPITVAVGDGIGPEIMDACLWILEEYLTGSRYSYM